LSKFTALNKPNIKFVKQLLFLAIFTSGFIGLQAQNNQVKKDKKTEKRERINARLKLEEEGEPAFKKYNLFSIQAASDGYGIFFEKGKYKSARKSMWYRFELNERKHPSEKKTANSINLFSGQVNSSVYGKSNNFYQFKLGTGFTQLIGGKANKNGVSVSAIYGGGISLGLLKPYYVNVPDSVSRSIVKVSFDSFYVNPGRYGDFPVGAAGFGYGWKDLKIRPGLHAKAAMRFDYGRFNEMITAIEAGVNIEYYFKEVRQMVERKPRTAFFNAYIAIGFGRRK
jgi:hypothetical protein